MDSRFSYSKCSLQVAKVVLMRVTHEKFWRRVAFLLILLGLCGFLWSFQIWLQYWDKLPRAPDRASGRIYADNFHGVVVYMSSEERFRLYTTRHSAEGIAALGFLIWGLCEWKWPRKDKFSFTSGSQGTPES